tara:strand:- start:150 stop:479 length:330 start_codon:yes stop_codon:yes gene_type:complete
MFTKIEKGRRCCIEHSEILVISWDYIKEVLQESGFEVVQKASPSEYIMRGCKGKILVYVKFTSAFEATLVFLNESDESDQLRFDWSDKDKFIKNGDLILSTIRKMWEKI